MHFLSNIRWRIINNNSLSLLFRECKLLHHGIYLRLDKWIFNFDSNETFIMNTDGFNNIIFLEVIYDFLSELFDIFAPERCSKLFILISVELLHGRCCNIFTLIFGTILKKNFLINGRKSFLDETFHGLFDQFGNKSAAFNFVHLYD